MTKLPNVKDHFVLTSNVDGHFLKAGLITISKKIILNNFDYILC
jgi:hypothetical protein